MLTKWKRGIQENENWEWEGKGEWREEGINEREYLFIYLSGFRLGDAEYSVAAV